MFDVQCSATPCSAPVMYLSPRCQLCWCCCFLQAEATRCRTLHVIYRYVFSCFTCIPCAARICTKRPCDVLVLLFSVCNIYIIATKRCTRLTRIFTLFSVCFSLSLLSRAVRAHDVYVRHPNTHFARCAVTCVDSHLWPRTLEPVPLCATCGGKKGRCVVCNSRRYGLDPFVNWITCWSARDLTQ